MNDTPETDAFCNQWPDIIEPIMIPAIMKDALILMSNLERERDDLRRLVAKLQGELTKALEAVAEKHVDNPNRKP